MKSNKKTIFIIGAGAIGKALAVFLQKAGKETVLLRGHINDGPACNEKVEVQLKDGGTVQAEIQVSTLGNYPTLDGTIVLATKSFSNADMAEKLKGRTGNSPIIVLQNGLNVEAAFISNAFPEIYRCVLFTSCQYIADNKLRFKPAAPSQVGTIKGSTEGLQLAIDGLTNAHLHFEPVENIHPTIWTKAIANSVFNSVCPLLETDNGIFHRNGMALNIAKRVIDECIIVAASQGVVLSSDAVLERLLLISRTSDGQLISTYQDILNKRKTEIGSLNMEMANIADNLEEKVSITATRLLGELVQIKSEISMIA